MPCILYGDHVFLSLTHQWYDALWSMTCKQMWHSTHLRRCFDCHWMVRLRLFHSCPPPWERHVPSTWHSACMKYHWLNTRYEVLSHVLRVLHHLIIIGTLKHRSYFHHPYFTPGENECSKRISTLIKLTHWEGSGSLPSRSIFLASALCCYRYIIGDQQILE